MVTKIIALCHLMECANKTKGFFEESKAKNSNDIEFVVMRDLSSLEKIIKTEGVDHFVDDKDNKGGKIPVKAKKIIVIASAREALMTSTDIDNILSKTKTPLVIVSTIYKDDAVKRFTKRGIPTTFVTTQSLSKTAEEKTLWVDFFNETAKSLTPKTKVTTNRVVTT